MIDKAACLYSSDGLGWFIGALVATVVIGAGAVIVVCAVVYRRLKNADLSVLFPGRKPR